MKLLSVAFAGPYKTEKKQKLPPIYSNPNSEVMGDRKKCVLIFVISLKNTCNDLRTCVIEQF